MRTDFRLRLLLTLAVTALAAVVIRPTLSAQADARERILFVSALDDAGEPVANLAPRDIVVREDGARREVLRVSRATEPIDIALLVDNSAAASQHMLFMREALTKFVTTLAPDNHIALITLADRPTIAVDYTNDADRLAKGTGRLFAMAQSGMTLIDAIIETSRGLEKRETSRAVIVPVITDGAEFTNYFFRDAVTAVKRANAPVHIVLLGQFLHTNDRGGARERSLFLNDGPSGSGGQQVQLMSPMGLDKALQKLARELSGQFKVVYGRPQSLIPPEKIEITSARDGVTMRGAPARGQTGD